MTPTPAVAAVVQPGPPATEERTLFEGQPALVPSAGALLLCIVTLGLALIYFWARRRGTSYRITNQRIVIDRGIFSKTLDQTDLYRINDFVVDRPFGQRLMGTGNIRMQTFDKSTPQLEIVGLKTDVVALYEKLRAAVDIAKRTQGVRMVDYEQ
jgi:uncharacterized membrane protein YdbT with pleckstrin-like domain